MKKILIISFSDLKSDPRVNRQIRTLSRNYKVLAAGTGNPEIPEIQFIPIEWNRKGLIRKIIGAAQISFGVPEQFYWSQPGIKSAYETLEGIHFDIVLANDLETLPLAVKLAGSRPILFDAHEFSPLEAEELWTFRTFMKPYRISLCRQYLRRASKMTTVCRPIAEKYRDDFGVIPEVITNATDFQNIFPFSNKTGKIQLVHHGVAAPSRRLELLIEMMENLEAFELNFFLVGNEGYVSHLKSLASKFKSIHFHDPVPTRELPKVLNRFDVGVYNLPPSSFNNRNALPNKFFEYIQARLAIGISPSPEMARIVKQYDLGVVAEDFTPNSLAQSLQKLDFNKIQNFKENAHKHAQTLSAQPNEEKLLQLVSNLVEIEP